MNKNLSIQFFTSLVFVPLMQRKKFTVQTFGEDTQFFKFRDNIKIAKKWLKILIYCSIGGAKWVPDSTAVDSTAEDSTAELYLTATHPTTCGP